MGIPFPLGLQWLATSHPHTLAWAWGINGFASILGASLATLLSIQIGSGGVMFLALLLYALALMVFTNYKRHGASRVI